MSENMAPWTREFQPETIPTSHDLTPNAGLVREISLFQGNLGWRNIIPFGQINHLVHENATSHDLTSEKVGEEGKSPGW